MPAIWAFFAILASLQVLEARPLRAQAPTISIVAGGDVMLDRGVRAQIRKRGASEIFAGIAPILKRADFAFANLECPLALAAPKIARIPASLPTFKADPALAPILKNAGFDVFSLANNHALDCGPRGLLETLDALQKSHLQATGAGINQVNSLRPIVTRKEGVRIAWLAASEFATVSGSADSPGVAALDEASLCARVRAARLHADAVIVSLHWGIEYQIAPTPKQKLLARAILLAGADVILGHHSHVLGPIETVQIGTRRGLIAYSLGNLVFDSPSWNRSANRSALLQIQIGKSGLRSWKSMPLTIRDCRPSPQKSAQVLAAPKSDLLLNFADEARARVGIEHG